MSTAPDPPSDAGPAPGPAGESPPEVDPRDPVDPQALVDPVDPQALVDPVDPQALVDPVDPVEAVGAEEITWADEPPGPDGDGGDSHDRPGSENGSAISVEDLVQDLERVSGERDLYIDTSRRIQAEFENYRKQVAKREVENRERAAEALVTDILPVLDACDGAMASGISDIEPVRAALVDVLTKQGLQRIDGAEEPFDPGKHDAVLHEPGEDDDGPIVAEVMRAGYSWNGRVVRPAMVRVRGG